MKRQFKNNQIVTVGKLNTHSFKVGEKIKILKLDPTAIISDVPRPVPVYYAQSVKNKGEKWWIAETEIKEAKVAPVPESPVPVQPDELRKSALAWWEKLPEGEKQIYWEGYKQFTPSKFYYELTGREIQNIWAVATNPTPVKDKAVQEGFTGGEWVIVNGSNSKTLNPLIQAKKGNSYFTLCELRINYPFNNEEAEANARLICESKNMLSIVKYVKFCFGNEANYPEGTQGYRIAQEAKAIINRIESPTK